MRRMATQVVSSKRRANRTRANARSARAQPSKRTSGRGNTAPGRAAANARVVLERLECRVHIGVEEKERARRQRVVVDVRLEGISSGQSRDKIAAQARIGARRFLESNHFVLIEAASLGLARVLFESLPASRITIYFRKFVLPEVDHVAAEMSFDRAEAQA